MFLALLLAQLLHSKGTGRCVVHASTWSTADYIADLPQILSVIQMRHHLNLPIPSPI